MKRTIKIRHGENIEEREIFYIPIRFIIALIVMIAETAAVITITALCNKYIPFFYVAVYATQFGCVLRIINSAENPDYKIPWLLLVILIPIAGFMIYFMFYNRKLRKSQVRHAELINAQKLAKDDSAVRMQLESEDRRAFLQANQLCKMSGTHFYRNTDVKYYNFGEKMFSAMTEDLKKAEKFIFLEYFLIEEGLFWNSILDILKEKAAKGVEVRVLYDDIGCIGTLPGDYYKELREYGIRSVPFSILKGQANNEFNNRTHRKITVIDNKVAYTGGINLADEYINEKHPFGVWKDVGLRLEGEAVVQLTSIFLADYELNIKQSVPDFSPYYEDVSSVLDSGYVIPFGDGPRPVYRFRTAKTMIMNMLSQAKSYVYMMTPYLIIDNELCQAIENAAVRGVDVRIITPHIPDKKIIFVMTRSHYKRLMAAGVKIYEFEPGFVHAKVYLSDDDYGIVGTINLDYRSLVHHFENGVWLYKHNVLSEIKSDFAETMERSIEIKEDTVKENLLQKIIRALVKIFAPML